MEKTKKPQKPVSLLHLFVALLLSAAHIGLVSGRDMVTFHWPDIPQSYVYGIVALFICFTVTFT